MTTHINAYYQDVQDKEEACRVAKAELEAAKRRLDEKKQEDGVQEESKKDHDEAQTESPDESPKQDNQEKAAPKADKAAESTNKEAPAEDRKKNDVGGSTAKAQEKPKDKK